MHKFLSHTFIGLMFISIQGFSQIIPTGSGSYTTQLPPADAAGRNVNPNGTPRLSGLAASKPVPSSDWWTGLLTYDGANMYNYPLSLKGSSTGLVVSYTFLGGGANDTRQPMSPDQPLVIGVTGLTGSYPTVSDYSDWTVTASWNSGGHTFNAMMGMAMPFVYCTKGSSDVASVTVNMGTVSVQNEMIVVTNSLSGANFAVYAPTGSTWSQAGTTYTSTLAGKNYFSVAMLPSGIAATTAAGDFKQYAYVFPANTAVNWVYDNGTSTVRTTFTVTPDQKEGSGSTVFMGLLPHQWAHLSATSAQPGSYSYTTSRGVMKMLASNTFVVENKFKGILSTLPNTAKYSPGFDPAALNSKINMVKGEGLALWTDSYNEGLAMNRLIQVAKIADQIGNIPARDQIITTVKTRLENWFKADAGENAFLFYYNAPWSTLIGYPAGYSADANLNDHHFHYGYFISAAAAVEQFQPGWAANWGPMVNMLVKDAANWERTDSKFPFLRNFNPYAGHSFAAGLLNNEPHGNNQESSSEAMNFNAALINWGELTGNTAIRDLGIYLYTTEQTGIEEYWLDTSKRNFAPTYSQMMCSRVWSNGYDRGTFWTGDIAAMYGIEIFPLTGASLYLGHNQTYVQKLWDDMKTKTAVLAKTPNDNLWFDIYWSYLALADPQTALTLYDAYPGYKPKGGCSDAQTYHWLQSLNGSGPVDASITADYPIAVVFNRRGDKTYVAHNYSAGQITVAFSDGFSMTVPARTMKTSKDIAVTATLASSATQAATNGSVNLSVSTTGSGITKVEFYDGQTLLSSLNTAPYATSATNLIAKIHGFYAKVYVGTGVQLSNVVSVIVGSQHPYSGTAIAIPSQVIEAGNYDTYEGGVGQNITYFDTSSSNDAGTFRAPEYVDAGPTTGEGNTVGYIENGEWLEYTVNIVQAGTYDLSVRYTSGKSTGGGPFHIEVDGVTVAGAIKVGFTDNNYKIWASKTINGVILPAGQHILRLVFDQNGFNIGKLTFTYKGTATPSLSVSTTALSVTMMANSTKTFDISSNIGWTASSSQGWLTVNNPSGFGNSVVTLSAQENTTTMPRTATVKVSGSGVSDQVISVTQEAGGISYLSVSATTLNIGFTAASTQTFDITANVNWTATSNQTWLKVTGTSGTGSAKITLTADANTSASDRVATVTLTGAGLSAKTITIMQGAAPLPLNLPIDFETGSFAFTDFDGGTATVISNPFPSGINTSTKVARIVRNGGATWAGSYLTLANKIDFTNSAVFSMKVYSPRAGMPVLFKLEGGQPTTEISVNTTVANGWETLTWNFAGKSSNLYNVLTFMFDFGAVGDGSANSTFLFDDIKLGNNSTNSLTVSSNALTIQALAGSIKTFNISSNVSWSALSNQSWINLNSSTGSGNGAITLTAQANPTVTSRVATITISGTGVTSQLITVTQDGAAPVLNVSSNVLTIASPAYSTKTFDITSNISYAITSDQSWLTLSNNSGSGNGTITLTATANPTFASRIATVIISGPGTESKTITVTQDSGVTGIIDMLTEEQLNIYPNPAADILNIGTTLEVIGVAVYDLNGKLIFRKKLTNNQLNVSNLMSGIYTLSIECRKGLVNRKFIKQ